VDTPGTPATPFSYLPCQRGVANHKPVAKINPFPQEGSLPISFDITQLPVVGFYRRMSLTRSAARLYGPARGSAKALSVTNRRPSPNGTIHICAIRKLNLCFAQTCRIVMP